MSKFAGVQLTKAQKVTINNERRIKILNFLSVETWSTADNLRLLLTVNHNAYIRRLLDRMIEDGLINKRHFIVNGSKRNIYLISDCGLLELRFIEKSKPAKVLIKVTVLNQAR